MTDKNNAIEKCERRHTMAQFIRDCIFEGCDNDFILHGLRNNFGVDKNSKYINWYRSQLRRQIFTIQVIKTKSGSFEYTVASEIPKGWVILTGAATVPNGYEWISNGESLFSGRRKIALVKK